MKQKLLQKMRYLLILYFMTLLVGESFAQSALIKGKITDENNGPLPGVTILLKGTNVGATSNTEGDYSLQVPTTSGVLVVSFIGYTTREIPIDNRTSINVNLVPDAQAL